MKILLTDADEALAALTVYALGRRGHQATTAVNGDEAWRRWSRERPDLLLIDPVSCGIDKLGLLSRVREVSSVPIVVLSTCNSDADIVGAFERGADDYIVKPFSLRQLLVRVEAVMRRARPSSDLDRLGHGASARYHDLLVDPAAFEACKNGHRLGLTHLELRLLFFLVANAGQIVSTEQLSTYGWSSPGAGDARLLKTHVCHIRGKLASSGGMPVEICAVPRTGYILREGPGEVEPIRSRLGKAATTPSRAGTPRSVVGVASLGDGRVLEGAGQR